MKTIKSTVNINDDESFKAMFEELNESTHAVLVAALKGFGYSSYADLYHEGWTLDMEEKGNKRVFFVCKNNFRRKLIAIKLDINILEK